MSLNERGLGRRSLAVAAISALALLATEAPASADFCESEVINDYAKPLKRLPKLPSPPVDEHLGFGPSRVYLGNSGYGPLQLGPGQRGFHLFFGQATSASKRVGWLVTARLTKLDRRARALAPPQVIERSVKRVPGGTGLDFSFEIPGKPAIYKVEIIFENGAGERLARFGEYFRVLRPSLDVEFVLNGSAFHRGDRVTAYLINRGVSFLSFGLEKTIQYYDGTSWVTPPVPFSSGFVPLIGLGIGPGVKTTCWDVTVPAEAPLGTYRFMKTVDHSTRPPFSRRSPLELSAEFTVTE
jgi:hypothetical protein